MKSKTIYIVSGICIALILIIITVVGGFRYINCQEGELVKHKDTKLVLHLSTHSNSYGINFVPRSYVLYYDENGKKISGFKCSEEVVSDFIVTTDESDYYFYKNETAVCSKNRTRRMENTSQININSTNFGPSKVGYVDKHEIAYSLLNVGAVDGEYTNIVRFVSETKNYDIKIPYYLEFI